MRPEPIFYSLLGFLRAWSRSPILWELGAVHGYCVKTLLSAKSHLCLDHLYPTSSFVPMQPDWHTRSQFGLGSLSSGSTWWRWWWWWWWWWWSSTAATKGLYWHLGPLLQWVDTIGALAHILPCLIKNILQFWVITRHIIHHIAHHCTHGRLVFSLWWPWVDSIKW